MILQSNLHITTFQGTEKKIYIGRKSIYGKFIFKKIFLDSFFSLILMILIISLISKPHLMISSSNSVLNCMISKKYLRHYFFFIFTKSWHTFEHENSKKSEKKSIYGGNFPHKISSL